MIKFLASSEGRPLIGLGLSRGNCAKLLAGKPIFIDLKVMMMQLAELPNLNDGLILVFGGENEAAMQAEIESMIGKAPAIHKHSEEN